MFFLLFFSVLFSVVCVCHTVLKNLLLLTLDVMRSDAVISDTPEQALIISGYCLTKVCIPLLLKSNVHTKGVITITHTVITIFLGCIFMFHFSVIENTEYLQNAP